MKTEFLTLIKTLASGETSVTFTNDAINTNSVIEIYTDNFEVYPDSVDVNNHTLTINFDKQINDVNVKIVINNIANNGAIEIPTNVFELDGMLTPDPNYRYCPVLLDYDENNNPILQKDYSGLIPRAISMLRDVALTSPSDGNILVYYDGYWYNKNNTIDELTNTEITTPTNDDVLTYDNGVWVNKPSQGGSSGVNYSTEEQDTGKTWVDGSKIYQKSYVHSGGINTTVVLDTITGFNELIDVELCASNSARTYWLSTTSSNSDNTMRVEVLNDGTVRLRSDTSWSNPKANITIYYTKVVNE